MPFISWTKIALFYLFVSSAKERGYEKKQMGGTRPRPARSCIFAENRQTDFRAAGTCPIRLKQAGASAACGFSRCRIQQIPDSAHDPFFQDGYELVQHRGYQAQDDD